MLTFTIGVTSLYCFALMWVAHDGTDKAHYFGVSLGITLVVVAGFWHMAGAPGYMVVNLAVLAGLACSIHAYTIVWQAAVSPKEGSGKISPSLWLIGSGIAVALISSLWFSMSDFFVPSASKLAINIHGQDLLVAMFAGVTGIAALDLKPSGQTPSYIISWLLPMAAVYFTCETKMLAHLQVGTPFHPSWHARQLAPIWGGSEIVNFTFWIATFLLTAFGTTVTCLFIMKYTNCTEGWNRMVFHGTLMIFVSGWFMAVFVSGLPPPLAIMAPTDPKVPGDVATIPPNLPNASKDDAVAQHKKDLQIGLFLMAAGPLLHKSMPKDTSALSWLVITVGWFLLIVGKVRLAFGVGAGLGVENP